jgi:hypothetical protein
MIAFPIPAPTDTPPIVGVLFAIAAAAGFVVLVWQAVRYLRREEDGDGDEDDRPDR